LILSSHVFKSQITFIKIFIQINAEKTKRREGVKEEKEGERERDGMEDGRGWNGRGKWRWKGRGEGRGERRGGKGERGGAGVFVIIGKVMEVAVTVVIEERGREVV
jgi:hypothetical protein